MTVFLGEISAARFERELAEDRDYLLRLAVKRTQNREEAEDLLQAATVRAYLRLDSFKGENFRGWMGRIITNLAINEYHRARRQPISVAMLQIDLESLPNSTDVGDPLSPIERRVLRPDLALALDGLPEPFRRLVEMVDVEGLSYADAAEREGIVEGTVKSRLSRARALLRERLNETAGEDC